MTNPYARADMAHDRDLCDHDARIDAWERDWDLLRKNLKAEVRSLGYMTPGVIDIIEKTAGDIIDLYYEEKNGS